MPEHEKEYRKYFEIKETPKRGISVTYHQDKIDEAHERYGFFALLSNEVKDPITALKLYRMRDIAEKAFWNYKDRLNLRRTLTSSESSLEGKLFVEFVAGFLNASVDIRESRFNRKYRCFLLNKKSVTHEIRHESHNVAKPLLFYYFI